jgi:hypothetical protein
VSSDWQLGAYEIDHSVVSPPVSSEDLLEHCALDRQLVQDDPCCAAIPPPRAAGRRAAHRSVVHLDALGRQQLQGALRRGTDLVALCSGKYLQSTPAGSAVRGG